MKRTLVVTVLLLISVTTYAQDAGLSAVNLSFFRPTLDPYGFLSVNGPELLPAGKFYLDIGQNFQFKGPVVRFILNGQSFTFVEKIHTASLTASVGFSDYLTMGLNLPFHWYARERNVGTLLPFTTRSLGDLQVALKLKLLSEREKRPGLALLVTTDVPTGNDRKFLGSSRVVPGVELIAGKDFKHVKVGLNTGVRFPPQTTVIDQTFGSVQLTYGLGLSTPMDWLMPNFEAMAEVGGHLEPANIREVSAPIGMSLGFRKRWENGLSLTTFGGVSLNNAAGNTTYRTGLSLGYSSAIPVRERVEALEPVKTIICFDSDRRFPTKTSLPWIGETAKKIKKQRKLKKILVEGHTDITASRSHNGKLSRKRAEMVKQLLIENGVDSSKIEVSWWGFDRPVASNKTREGRRLNRRVEISTP